MDKKVIIDLCSHLGLKLEIYPALPYKKTDARYYFKENIIAFYGSSNTKRFIFEIAHEIGHFFQSSLDFSQIKHITFIRKRNYVYRIELDAWRKAKKILLALYPSMTKKDWKDFTSTYTECLDNYINLDEETISEAYDLYFEEFLKNREVKKNIREICLEFSNKSLSLHP